jgi:DNA-directed RNA polymerase subunit RPC12/RpoP
MVWQCKDCNFEFGAPMIDSKTNEKNCPYCGSIFIERK